ncbi:MAG: hypothetical protein IJA74_02850 [Oscillospiraceae bacterium]|nr:hypothetical protein [Oscillospiraceae bacterium]
MLFIVGGGIRKLHMQYAGGILLTPVQTLVATLIFAQRAKMQTNLTLSANKKAPLLSGAFYL